MRRVESLVLPDKLEAIRQTYSEHLSHLIFDPDYRDPYASFYDAE